MNKSRYITCCVNSTARDIDDMMDQAVEITYRTFARHVKIWEVEEMLGYEGPLTLAKDCAVTFYRSKFKGKRCYVVRHSEIEFIFG